MTIARGGRPPPRALPPGPCLQVDQALAPTDEGKESKGTAATGNPVVDYFNLRQAGRIPLIPSMATQRLTVCGGPLAVRTFSRASGKGRRSPSHSWRLWGRNPGVGARHGCGCVDCGVGGTTICPSISALTERSTYRSQGSEWLHSCGRLPGVLCDCYFVMGQPARVVAITCCKKCCVWCSAGPLLLRHTNIIALTSTNTRACL
jgi:hypothetical protein